MVKSASRDQYNPRLLENNEQKIFRLATNPVTRSDAGAPL